MHGNHQRSMGRRIIWQVFHLILVLNVFWLLFGDGLITVSLWFGTSWNPGDSTRRIFIFLASMILFFRWGITNFVLLQRQMPWIEIIIVCIELLIIHFAFAILGGRNANPFGAIEFIGLVMFVIGSYLNTGSEIMRYHWKKDPQNKGKIYDQGLFKYSMHINYFGDAVWSTGMALISGNIWIFLIPLYMSCGFVFLHIPRLDKYLIERYGLQYEAYAIKTKKIIPFIY